LRGCEIFFRKVFSKATVLNKGGFGRPCGKAAFSEFSEANFVETGTPSLKKSRPALF